MVSFSEILVSSLKARRKAVITEIFSNLVITKVIFSNLVRFSCCKTLTLRIIGFFFFLAIMQKLGMENIVIPHVH